MHSIFVPSNRELDLSDGESVHLGVVNVHIVREDIVCEEKPAQLEQNFHLDSRDASVIHPAVESLKKQEFVGLEERGNL